VPALAEGHVQHWSYGGATGPARWAGLEPEFSVCGVGREQSPIDIRHEATQKMELPRIQFDYRPSPLRIIDNGHTIQVAYAPGSFIDVAGHRYQLVQFHFHKPSEESIDGKHSAMVAHLVHQDAEGQLAVVAVMLTPGALNPAVALIWNNLPIRKGTQVEAAGVNVDAAELLPSDRGYYTFNGSLTTPPCSEKVTWYVLQQSSTLSLGEIERFARAYPMNARPTQPLNGRTVRASQ
ncbi:MAG: carbonic anhydrase family protein, partial [Proteobacteria bacterium]|nr:carbonic anhydrase family protein [Pseudomonadota bacterium]